MRGLSTQYYGLEGAYSFLNLLGAPRKLRPEDATYPSITELMAAMSVSLKFRFSRALKESFI
jgi:hypothetical protein